MVTSQNNPEKYLINAVLSSGKRTASPFFINPSVKFKIK
jgi:hypothetical protein